MSEFDDFWNARTEHQKKVAAALKAAQDVINEGVDAGLYKDGLTSNLMRVQEVIPHLAGQLDPSLVPQPGVPFTPGVPIPQA